MADENLPPLEEGQELTPEMGIVKPPNYDMAHLAYYAHIFDSQNNMLGSGIVDGDAIVDFRAGSSKEFSGLRVKLRYGEEALLPPPALDINLYPGWATATPNTTVYAFGDGVDMLFSIDGTAAVAWTLQYTPETDEPIPGSETSFIWGDGLDFGSKQYEISASIVDRWESENGLNYPYLSIAENTWLPITEGFAVGIREQGWVDSAVGFITVSLTVRQTDDIANSATGVFTVTKQGIDAPVEPEPMMLVIDTSLIIEDDPGEVGE